MALLPSACDDITKVKAYLDAGGYPNAKIVRGAAWRGAAQTKAKTKHTGGECPFAVQPAHARGAAAGAPTHWGGG